MNQHRPRRFQVRNGTSLNVAEFTVVPLSISILDFLEESATTPGSTATAAGIKTVLKTTNAAPVPFYGGIHFGSSFSCRFAPYILLTVTSHPATIWILFRLILHWNHLLQNFSILASS